MNAKISSQDSQDLNAAVQNGENAVRALWLRWARAGKSQAQLDVALVVAERVALKTARNIAGA